MAEQKKKERKKERKEKKKDVGQNLENEKRREEGLI
jgi:hypothetical protein